MLFVRTALLTAALVATSASAKTYDAVADFSGTPTGVWSYGTGGTGTSFTAMTSYSAVCEGADGISCWQTPTPVSRVPLVAKNNTGATMDIYGTVVMPTDVLNVHPGPSTDSIVRFTAPKADVYKIKGFFELLDTNPSGVNLIVAINGTIFPYPGNPLSGPAASFPSTPGGKVSFGGNTGFFVAKGGTIDFGVNNAGSFYNDSTGLSATITGGVPEPMTWSLLVAGFALVGVAARRRSTTVAA